MHKLYYGRFEIVSPPADADARTDGHTDGRTDEQRRLCIPPYKMLSILVDSVVSVSITLPYENGTSIDEDQVCDREKVR